MNKDLKSLIIFLKASSSLERNIKNSLLGTGINISEFTAMEALYHKGPLTTQELIDTILISNSSMTYVLEILEEKNYINRKKKPDDKRVQILSLSKPGKDFFREVYNKHFSYMRSIFDVLSNEEEILLQDLLKKLGKKAMKKLRSN
ncbi:MAG TPA: MarR family transcriptional regulator [Candidatus Eisenbacteria bacterium]|nr:MarR family transcriptional regulator [Candidatus Eisenbacteria bacterium]